MAVDVAKHKVSHRPIIRNFWFLITVVLLMAGPAGQTQRAAAQALSPLIDDFRIAGLNGVRLDSLDFAVEVGPSDTAELRVQVFGTAQDSVVFTVIRNTLRVRIEPQLGWLGRSRTLRLIRVAIPHNQWIAISGSAGSVSVSNLVADQLGISVADGDVTLTDVSGRISAYSGNGTITTMRTRGAFALQVAGGRLIRMTDHDGGLTVRAPSADGYLTNVIGTFDVESARGSIVVNGIGIRGHSFFRSIAGHIRLANVADPDGLEKTVYTVTGNLHVPASWEQRRFGLNTRAVRLPQTTRLHLEVVNGLITVQ